MTDSFDRFNKFNPYVTINRDVIEAQNNKTSDVDQPYNLVEWIISTSETFGTPDDYIKNHTLYVKRWYQTKNQSREVTRTRVVNNYVKFLKEVLLVHDNQEEARYLMNVDWEDTYDMDIAVPYFANRLRQVVLYVVEQREKIKFEKIRNSYRGSSAGVTKYIYDQIIELLNSEKYYLKYGNRLPDAVKTAKDLTVTLSEKYDVAEHITGQPLADVDYDVYTDFDQVVIKILNNFPTELAEDGETLTETGAAIIPSLPADPNDLSRLYSSYFYNYTTGKDTLNINLHKAWLERYGSGTMYYLSAGEGTDYAMDTLYVPKYHLYNHTNTGVPEVLYSQPTDRLKTLEHMGGFFKSTGISHAYSLDLEYVVNTTGMSAGEIQYFTDPQYTGVDTPGIIQYEDVSYMKADASNDALHGDIIDAEQFQKFYPYQSMDESNKYPKFGVSKNTDNFDFWKGDNKDVWSNSDIYPVHLTYNYQEPTEQRTKDLLLGSKCVSNWRTDIFGNDYALLKESIRPKLHGDPLAPVDNPCRVLDAEGFWDDTTFQRPPYTDNVDGAPSFRCYDLKLYTDYAYGGYFSPYHCTEFVCYEPNHVEYPDCPAPFVLSGHKATNDPTILNYWLSNVGGPGATDKNKTFDAKAIFDLWPRSSSSRFYTMSADYAGVAGINDWVWDSVTESPFQPENTSFSSFLSPQKYSSTTYKHNAVLQSTGSDDDHNGLVMAYVTRPHPTLQNLDGSPQQQIKMLIAGRSCSGDMPTSRWGIIIIDWGGSKSTILQANADPGAGAITLPGWDRSTDNTSGGWNSQTTGVEVTRSNDIITAKCSYYKPAGTVKMQDHISSPEWQSDETKFTIDLNSDPAFADFLGPTGYGYCNQSQADSFFNDSAAFASPPPPDPVDYDIYDFTQCKPQIWKYSVPRNLWYVHPDDEFDDKVAGDGVLVVDKDGCGSYGFDCLGRCLTVPAISACGPPPPPPEIPPLIHPEPSDDAGFVGNDAFSMYDPLTNFIKYAFLQLTQLKLNDPSYTITDVNDIIPPDSVVDTYLNQTCLDINFRTRMLTSSSGFFSKKLSPWDGTPRIPGTMTLASPGYIGVPTRDYWEYNALFGVKDYPDPMADMSRELSAWSSPNPISEYPTFTRPNQPGTPTSGSYDFYVIDPGVRVILYPYPDFKTSGKWDNGNGRPAPMVDLGPGPRIVTYRSAFANNSIVPFKTGTFQPGFGPFTAMIQSIQSYVMRNTAFIDSMLIEPGGTSTIWDFGPLGTIDLTRGNTTLPPKDTINNMINSLMVLSTSLQTMVTTRKYWTFIHALQVHAMDLYYNNADPLAWKDYDTFSMDFWEDTTNTLNQPYPINYNAFYPTGVSPSSIQVVRA